ncbi:hypothetical protein [Dyadobacter fanqingshengii]|uniref:Uncharacterized protein n=1 Tax=Dyadobacter fanqingshengii TaxID=2906443 RepID=A0A9X1P7A7_9BACT|nr:hypothetical protein [Dyadobacter fanqingshengii]MCF0040164.1 hypothetical protein [Dyadobacter fanqingshengii]USJ38084.1 hypothetical protein NFI81_09915 [Dyadobacter fanqingshengii]
MPADASLDNNVKVVPTRMSYPLTQASLNGAHHRTALHRIAERIVSLEGIGGINISYPAPDSFDLEAG